MINGSLYLYDIRFPKNKRFHFDQDWPFLVSPVIILVRTTKIGISLKGILMETPQETSRLRLLFTFTYAIQCLAWISFVVYLTVVGPAALAVMVAFPVEISSITQYFLQLSVFLTNNPWITYGLVLWTGITGTFIYPRVAELFPANGFDSSAGRFSAYSAVLQTCFSLCLVMILTVIGTEALLGPIDAILEASFGSRLEFLEAFAFHNCFYR